MVFGCSNTQEKGVWLFKFTPDAIRKWKGPSVYGTRLRNKQCLYKQDATSHTKSCTCIYSVVIPIHMNRVMASVYTSFSYSSNLKYTVYGYVN